MNSLDPGDRVLVIEQSFIGHIEEINPLNSPLIV